MDAFTKAQKVNIHLGHFYEKICQQELSKIAQSSHTNNGDLLLAGGGFMDICDPITGTTVGLGAIKKLPI